jgi:hypothetical protein
MANYPYIIASFPDLLLESEHKQFDSEAVLAEVKSQLSDKDCQLVDWLEFGLDESHLGRHFYRKVQQCPNRFLAEWFEFDRKLRLAKVAYLENEPFSEPFPELDKAELVFNVNDLYQRERLYDRLCWNKAVELVEFDIFTLDTILSLLVRLHIAARWKRLDPETGKQLFAQLVSEVRGTFQGINAEQL